MAESPLNDHRSLSAADVTDTNLKVQNGSLVDGAGNPVTLGSIEDDNEAEFGDADEGVRGVKDGTPSGDLVIDSDGDIAVDGYGKVTLVGPYREVSTVGGTGGHSGSIYVNANGGLEFEYTTTERDVYGIVSVSEETDTTPPLEVTTDPSNISLKGTPIQGELQNKVSIDDNDDSVGISCKFTATNVDTDTTYGPKEANTSRDTDEVVLDVSPSEFENDTLDITSTDEFVEDNDPSWSTSDSGTLNYSSIHYDYNYEKVRQTTVSLY